MRLFGSIPVGGGVRLGAATNVGSSKKGLDKRSRTVLYVVAGIVLLSSMMGGTPHKAPPRFSGEWKQGVVTCDAVRGTCVIQ